MSRGAGILLFREDGAVLLAQRSLQVSDPGYWAIPGGRVERGETDIEAAVREFIEEMGSLPPMRFEERHLARTPKGRFMTVIATITNQDAQHWQPKLNWEHSDWGWFYPDRLPHPLHPGVAVYLQA